MGALPLSPGRTVHTRSRPYRYLVSLLAALAFLAVPGVASAANGFQEQIAKARWSTPFQCPDGSTADGQLAVETDNFIDAGTTRNPSPPFRFLLSGQCPDGTYQLGSVRPAATTFDSNLKSVTVSGTFTGVRDNRGVLHTVSVDVTWTGTGPLMTTVNGPGSKTMERTASATATFVVDGSTVVDGPANFPFPAPSIRVDTEK